MDYLDKRYAGKDRDVENLKDLKAAFQNLMEFWETGKTSHTMKTFEEEHAFNLNDFAMGLLRHIAETNRHTDGRINPHLAEAARKIWGFD